MERSNDDMQQLRETLSAQTTAADAAIAHKDSELQVKEKELQEFAAQTQQNDAQMQQKDAELADIAVQLEHMVLEVQEKETALGLKMAELKALREEADGVQHALSHDATNKSVEIAAHVHTIAQLHMALEQGVKALTDKDNVLTDKDKALTDKDGQLEAAVATLDEHSLRLTETQVALAANESALQDLHQQMTEAEEEHLSGNTELQLQVDSLKKEIAEVQKESGCASATADRHVETIAELQDSLSSKTNACSEMLQQLRAKTEECKELGADVQRRNEREERLQKDVQRETGSNTSLHTKLEALEERCVCCVCLLVCMPTCLVVSSSRSRGCVCVCVRQCLF